MEFISEDEMAAIAAQEGTYSPPNQRLPQGGVGGEYGGELTPEEQTSRANILPEYAPPPPAPSAPRQEDLVAAPPQTSQEAFASLEPITAENSTPSEYAKLSGKPAATEGWWRDPSSALMAAVDGVMWGWADETIAGILAMEESTRSTKTYDQLYDEKFAELQADRDEFSSQHPYADFMLNVVGGIFTGGPALAAAKGVKAATAGAGMPRLANIAGQTGLGAAEGAIAGAGSARPGERASGAGMGAAFGGAISGGATGVGSVFHAPKSGDKNVTGNLLADAEIAKHVPDDEFVPINIAAEKGSLPQQFYAKLLGASWPGRNAIMQQSEEFVKKFHVAHGKLQADLAEMTKKAAEAAENVKRTIAHSKKMDAIQDQHTTATTRQAKNAARKAKEREMRQKASAKQQEALIMSKLEQDAVDHAFRLEGARQALSSSMSDSVRKKIAQATNGHDRNRLLSSWWSRYGFDFIKRKTFKVSVPDINASLMKTLDRSAASPQVKKEMLKVLDSVSLQWKGDSITGDDFLSLRNRLAIEANSIRPMSSDDFAKQGVMRDMVHDLDKGLMNSMDAATKKKFKQEKDAYRAFTIARQATEGVKDIMREGNFTPQEWADAAATMSPRAAGKGEAFLQKTAKEAENNKRVLQEGAQASVDSLGVQLKSDLADVALDAQEEMTQAMTNLKRVQATSKHAGDLNTFNQAKAREAKILAEQQHLVDAIEAVETRIAELKEMSPGHDSWFLQFAAIQALAAMLGGTSSIAVGMAGSAALSTKAAQKLLQSGIGLSNNQLAALTAASSKRAAVLSGNTGEEAAITAEQRIREDAP